MSSQTGYFIAYIHYKNGIAQLIRIPLLVSWLGLGIETQKDQTFSEQVLLPFYVLDVQKHAFMPRGLDKTGYVAVGRSS